MKKNKKKRPRVYIAMSGGVDSSVSVALLKKGWFLPAGRQVDVVGVYMKQWSPSILGVECPWKEDRRDALRVATHLGVSFLTWDFSKEYEKEVGNYMIDSYKKGITPNPDIMCNKVIKFGLFYEKAMKEGADFVATGHYARIVPLSGTIREFSISNFSRFAFENRGSSIAEQSGQFSNKSKIRNFKLAKAKDSNKDQTYFLYTLNKNQLDKILFPVGNLTKPQVRSLAKKFKLHNAEKKDSQGVCFVGQFNMKNFLKEYIKPKKGKILSLSNEEIGQHDGVYYYTIGQRHGLDIKTGKGPYFVVKKNIKKNLIYVGGKKDLLERKIVVKNIHWIEKPQKFPLIVEVRCRYRSPLTKALLDKNGVLSFKKPQEALAPGQSAVFYKGEVLLGGGVIA